MATEADSLQIALFVEAREGRSALVFWQKAFKAAPLGFNTLGGASSSTGVQGDYAVTLQVQPNRVDLLVGPAGANPESVVRIPDIKAAMRFGIGAVERILPGLPVERVAIVLQRTTDKADADEAVATVKASLPGVVAPLGAQDLYYQTRVDRFWTGPPALKLSFVRRWNTGIRSYLQVTVGLSQAPMFGPSEGKIVVLDHVDVFSADPHKLFPKRAIALLDELARVAEDLLSRGYDALLEQGAVG